MKWRTDTKNMPKDRPFLTGEWVWDGDPFPSGPNDWCFEVAWWEPAFDAFIVDTCGPEKLRAMSSRVTHWADIPLPNVIERQN